MTTFSSVKLYNRCRFRTNTSPPYTYSEYEEADLHKPIWTNSNLPPELNSSDLLGTYSDLTPRKGRELSEMELPIEMMRLFGQAATYQAPRFLEITYSGTVIYGWIDSVDSIATKGPKVNTLIRWHVDYWLTAQRMNHRISSQSLTKQPVALGQGRVKRGLEASARPDPTVPRKWTIKSTNNIAGWDKPYIVVYYTSSNYSYLNTFPVGGSIENYGPCMDKFDAYNGNMIARMGLSSAAIIGIWVCPFNPIPTGSVQNDGTYYWYNSPFLANIVTVTLTVTETTTDDHIKTVVTDAYGNVAGTLPWGITYDKIHTTLDIGTTGANAIIEFGKGLVVGNAVYGEVISIPLPAIPVFSNAMNDYVFSGQRSYDLEMAKQNNERGLINGIANAGQGAVAGAVMGSIVPGVGTAIGAVAGAGFTAAGAGINFALQAHYDNKAQEATDRLMANQALNTVIGAGGPNWYYYSHSMAVITMERDSVSEAELSTEQTELGFITDYYETDCQTLILNGGGFRIEGVQVKGDILPEGRAYIQALFARGVHIDLIG